MWITRFTADVTQVDNTHMEVSPGPEHPSNNRDPKPFVWTKTADEILEKLGIF